MREDDLTVDSFNAVGQELRSRKILSSKEQGERLEWQMFQCPKIEAPVLILPSMLEEVVYRLQSQCGVKVEGEDLKTLMTEQVYDLLAAMAITVVKKAKWERYRWEKDFVNYKERNLGKSVVQDILRFLMQPEYYWQELE